MLLIGAELKQRQVWEEEKVLFLYSEIVISSTTPEALVFAKAGRAVISVLLLPHLPVDRCSPPLFIKQPDTQSLTSLSYHKHEFVYSHAVKTVCVYVVKQ